MLLSLASLSYSFSTFSLPCESLLPGSLSVLHRRRARIQPSAAYSSISARDTEVKQYNGCLLRPVPRGRGCTKGIIVDLLYLASPISRSPSVIPFALSLSWSPAFFFVEFSPGLDTHHRKTMRQLLSPTGTMQSLVASVLVAVVVVATVVLPLILPALRTAAPTSLLVIVF